MTDTDEDRAAFVAWARQNAVPISTCEPGSGVDDLVPLLDALRGARIVGLGEATHGTRDFFQLKHRLVEVLTDRAGFDQFQIEANLPDAMAVDEYVRHGFGAPDVALAGMYFWVWDSEEVLDLIEWMHVRGEAAFHGVDLQFAPEAVRRLLAACPAHERDRVRPRLTALLDPTLAEHWTYLDPEMRAAALATADEIALAVPRVAALAGFLQSWSEFTLQPDIWAQRAVRDRVMAEHALATLGEGRAMLWAHNQHVARDGFPGRFPSMGGHLHAALGDSYASVGFAFGSGGFRAGDAAGTLRDIDVGPPPANFLETALAEVGPPIFALTWTGMPSAARRWPASKPPQRNIGSGYAGDESSCLELDPCEQYDVLIYVDRTSPARPNPTGLRPRGTALDVAEDPVNLELADIDALGRPGGWVCSDLRAAGGYEVAVVDTERGKALQVTRPDVRWRNRRIAVHQKVRPKPGLWHFSAELRRVGLVETGSVRLMLEVVDPDGRRHVGLSDAPNPDGSWTPASAELDIVDGVESVTLAIVATGANPAYARRITVDR